MAEPLACTVLGMRCLGPVFGDPVVVIGAGTVGLLLQLLLLARGRVLLLSWTGSASGWRSPCKLGAAQAVTDAGALDGARFEVAVDATGGAGGDRDRVGLLGHGGRMVVFGVSPAPAAISVSPFRVFSDKIVITGPMAILRSFGPAGRRV
jgi:threonine dehydrogenase-like Zn-dependent dehydrogenase